jgi:triacylglycerol lipase
MLSRLQQGITLGLLLTAAVWAAWFTFAGSPHLAWVGALSIIFGYALFLALEFVFLRLVNRTDPTPQADAKQLLRAWWGEVLTAPQVFCWRQPFRSRAIPDWLPESDRPTSRGIVLVHGFVCNRAVWNPWMTRLRAHEVPYVAVNLEPVFGSIDDYAEIIERAVQRMEAVTGREPVLVAHSMGGLAVRAWLNRFAADDRVHRVITVGSPHHGTWMGRFARTRNTVEMQLNSAWRQALVAKEPPGRHARFTCFYSHCDNIAFPASTATLAGADNRHVPGVAHVHLLFQNEVFNEALRWLESPKEPATR